MAQQWRESTFVGLDIAAIQTDLQALAKAQQMLAGGTIGDPVNAAEVDWQDVADRVTWRIADL